MQRKGKKGHNVALLCCLGAIWALGATIAIWKDAIWARWCILQLETGSLETKKAAVLSLGNHPVAFAVPPLLEAASVETLRPFVHDSLVKIGSMGIPRLFEGLREGPPDGQRAAAEALRKLELERSERIGLETWFVTEGKKEEKLAGLRAFSELGPLPGSVIELLVRELLSAEDSTYAFDAILEALGRQGARAEMAIPVLVDWLFRIASLTWLKPSVRIPVAAHRIRKLSFPRVLLSGPLEDP